MAGGRSPILQQNSLPLISAAQFVSNATNGDVTVNVTGQGIGPLTRFWSPTYLGINDSAFVADANTFVVLLSNFINPFGCHSFTLVLTRRKTAASQPPAGVALSAITAYVQYRKDSGDTPPTSLGGTQQPNFCGATMLNGGAQGVIFPAMQSAAEVQRAVLSWDNSILASSPGAGAAFLATTMQGANVRLWLNIGSAAAPDAGNLFSAYLYGTS